MALFPLGLLRRNVVIIDRLGPAAALPLALGLLRLRRRRRLHPTAVLLIEPVGVGLLLVLLQLCHMPGHPLPVGPPDGLVPDRRLRLGRRCGGRLRFVKIIKAVRLRRHIRLRIIVQ